MKKAGIWIVFLTLLLLAACGGKTYTVSGRVIDAQGNGLEDVLLIFSGGISGQVKTGNDGHWQISGLKGTVTIRPQKTDWVFSPETRVVQLTEDQIIFTGNDGNHALIITQLDQYCQLFNQEDALGLMRFFHPDYYTQRGLTETEHLENLENRFFLNDWVVSKKSVENLVITGQRAEVTLLMEIELPESNLEYLWEFSLVQEETQWLIEDLLEIEYQVYLERPIIEELVSDFLAAWAVEDLSSIAAMTSDDYRNFQHGDKTGFLNYMAGLMQRLDIVNYQEKLERLTIYDQDRLFATVTVLADIVTGQVEEERRLKLDFNLVKEGNRWLLLDLRIQTDELVIFQMDINEADGLTELIEFTVTVFGEHNIRTSFLEKSCDTVLTLFDIDRRIISRDDDSGQEDFSLITANLAVGTYYVQIEEYSGKYLNCTLEITRLGL